MADRIEEPRHIVRASEDHALGAPVSATVGMARRRSLRSEPSPHSRKFRAATILLIGLAIGALVIATAIATSSTNRTSASAPWSAWSPPDGGTLGTRDIADHVAPLYRLTAAAQLAVVTVVNLSTPSTAGATGTGTGTGTGNSSGLQVAVKPDPNSGAVSLLSGTTIAYNLCGIGGSNCAIVSGQASTARLLLLRREALELALYTFKYIGGVENVVAILPPGHTQPTSSLTKRLTTTTASNASKPVDIAVLFVREELQPWLRAPLNSTLPEQFPPTVSQMASAPEAGLVDQITARDLFSEQLVKAQDGSNLIELSPLPPE